MINGKITTTDNGKIHFETTCQFCSKPAIVENIPADAFQRWQEGMFIQNALPMLTAGDREILISGTHDECWQKAFLSEEEESEEDG